MAQGTVESIQVSAEAEGAMVSVKEARAVPGRGIEGDRYFLKHGTYSKKMGPDREVTLIESEAVEAAARDYNLEAEPRDTRRNLVTRGVALTPLVGREFRVGPVRLKGIRLCEPCGHMEQLSGKPGIQKSLVHRGGLRAQILEGGVIRVGDAIVVD